MNVEKITIKQFRTLKNKMQSLLKEDELIYDEQKDNPNFNEEELEQKFMEQYIELQNQLLSYDLSLIPFEAWRDFQIMSDETHTVDFSKTRANIDFNLVEYYGNGNFRGCNVRNLDKIQRWLNPNDFDEHTIQMNSSLFLTDIFSNDFKDKYYSSSLTIDDLASLSSEQLEEIKQKALRAHMNYNSYNGLMLETLGLDKVVQLYNHSQEEYESVSAIFNMQNFSNYVFDRENSNVPTFEEFLEQIKSVDIEEIKNACFDFVKQQIINSTSWIRQEKFPESFIRENADIFLLDSNVPDEVKERYFSRRLKLQDLLDYPEAFKNISVDNFMKNSTYISQFVRNNYGMGKFQKLLQRHPDVFTHLLQEDDFYNFNKYLKKGKDLESVFTEAVKSYFFNYGMTDQFRVVTDGQINFNVPDWLASMNFQFVDKLNTTDELLQYTDSILVLDDDQRRVLDTLNIDNIRRLEQETGFFSHKGYEWSRDLEMFSAFGLYFYMYSPSSLEKSGIDFKNGSLSYEKFLDQLANCLDSMRKNNVFTDFTNYDWMRGNFRTNHPEIFMDLNAPDELKEAFYKNRVTPEFLYTHKEYLSYLINKNLSNTLRADIKLDVPGLADDQGNVFPKSLNFIDEYVSRYGNEKLLELISKYGVALSDITILGLHGEINNEQAIERSLRNSIYSKIKKGEINYSYLVNVSEFVSEHPDIFVTFDRLTNVSQDERQRLTNAFYTRTLNFDDIKKYPELTTILKDKDLHIAFGNKDGAYANGRININSGNWIYKTHSDLELLQVYGNEKFLELCSKYGRYMDGIATQLGKDITIRNGKYIDFGRGDADFENGMSFEEISKKIEDIIVRESKLGNLSYQPDDAPSFLKQTHPELFLGDGAPEELKKYFYNYGNNYPLTFKILQQHKDWMPYLQGKAISTSLLRQLYLNEDMKKFLQLFGEEKAIKLGINRTETVQEMLKTHKVDLMKSWYDKTGQKFIPDFVIMQNFNIDDADKFLTSGSNWSNLMKIKNFASSIESRDAMLKLAYSFGAFDQDQKGFKKLQELLTDLPRKIDANYDYVFDRIDQQINQFSQRKAFFSEKSMSYMDSNGVVHKRILEHLTPEQKEIAYKKMLAHTKNNLFIDLLDTTTLVNLLETIKDENIDIDFTKNVFAQIYRKNDDGSYTLAINPQSCPKTSQIVRGIIEKFREIPIITPDKAHQLFGGFELKYDSDFREFLLANMDEVLNNPEYVSLVASVQRQFTDIKAINSNRTLTWPLAVSYVQTNKYTSVNVGNERVAEISAIAGYSQADFNMLQQIYNYGKQRTFSSIPRIEKTSGKYSYEILRLDDPLAMAIGTLTDCCQELGNCAEVCMEHSMVDKNGRVFIIKDEFGNIVAQSWVWRNKDVLCFDNIEIPDKAFARAVKESSELGRKEFTDEVYGIYKKAAHDLIEEDEKAYKQLLEGGKITQEQYDGLRLGKITVGLGYNDIAESLKQNSYVDKGIISRPLPFEEPVKLKRGLYTNDSTTQYVLEEREDRKEFDGETLPIHSDAYIQYDNTNFTEKSLLLLEKLEIVTKNDPKNLETSVSDYADSEHLVTEIARNYGLNPETSKIIMNPNFAIIYDVNDSKLRVGELLFNTKVDNEQQSFDIENQVVMQIRLALEQIATDKEIDISRLGDKQKEIYAKVTGLTEEIDIERGVGHAR